MTSGNDSLIRDDVEMGKRLKQIRRYYGLRQRHIAERIHIHQSTIALFEHGKRFMKDRFIKLYCDEFNICEEWLLYGVGTMFRPKEAVPIDEYIEKYNLSPTERDIVLNFMELSEKAKQESLETFIESIQAAKRELAAK